MKQLWFRRKIYGWGWFPITWQGWLVIGVYVLLVILFALSVNKSSPVQEIAFTCILPIVLLTITLIRICIKTGEKPRWQWGKRLED